MKNQLALVALATQATALTVPSLSNRGGNIVGGEAVKIEDYPFQIQILKRGEDHCGGSIVSNRFIVTAAHCCHGTATDFSILAGSGEKDKGTAFKVANVTVHPKNDPKLMTYDACVVELATPLPLGPTIQPIAMVDTEPATGTDTIVSGFGLLSLQPFTKSSNLQAVHVPIVDHALCAKQNVKVLPVTADMICAGLPQGGKDSCKGDSGGPLMVDRKLAGIVSWGYDCAKPNYPGVYSSVGNWQIRSFINKVTGL